ncbi:acyl-CoA carboxylase subunit epsilon [Streptosporangium sp. NPDC051023]|uniref:acyl-CoA carboxylase subunit epsilon n=1 Tax=Streptosporangium sp. NPDC051023 TaxID=3155410 RepID=UPI00344D91C5
MGTDNPLLVVRGKPSDEELAAVVVAFLLLRRDARDKARPPVRKPFWIARPAYRGPLQRVQRG